MAYVALRANITYETWVAGWSLAVCEAKINSLFKGRQVLQHELTYWDSRHRSYKRRLFRLLIVLALVLMAVAYGWVTRSIWRASPTHATPWAWIAYVGVVIGAYAAVAHRICMLVLFASDPIRNEVIDAARVGKFIAQEMDGRPWWRALLGLDRRSEDQTSDEEQIRALVENWAEAVHSGDLTGVFADHSEDIVMFDVPPPYEGVRGINAYRETWLPFFEWQARGASFEIVSLDVTAGKDVAYAQALLRCGTPQELAANPESRLQLTVGLRKDSGQWVVAHEHHSFPDAADGDGPPGC